MHEEVVHVAANLSPAVQPDDRKYSDERGQVGYRPSVLLAAGFAALALSALLFLIVVIKATPPIEWGVEGVYIDPRDVIFDTLDVVLGWAAGVCGVIGLATLGVGFYRFARLLEPSHRA